MQPVDRRSFLAAAAGLPLWLDDRVHAHWAPRGDDRALVVLELVGGNDGLGTVIPVDDARLPALRPQLQVVRRGAHALGDGTALHPALARVARLAAAGRATIVHGVGYPEPDRSHFRSRDIWHVADPAHRAVAAHTTGWLGRAADLLLAASAGVPAAAVGGLEVPLALRARTAAVPSLRRVEDFQWLAGDGAPVGVRDPLRAVVSRPPAGGDLRAFAAATAEAAIGLADRLAGSLARYRPGAEYPDTDLGRRLRLCAQLLVSGFGTRLVHVPFDGFDTHARQLPTHQGLLAQLDQALDAFVADLVAHGADGRVAVLVHSEFGRRAAENASLGTDHGAAAPVVLLLGGCRGGPVGPVPDLARLVDGDLAATCDFRSVYADLLAWLGLPPAEVLGASFPPSGAWPGAGGR